MFKIASGTGVKPAAGGDLRRAQPGIQPSYPAIDPRSLSLSRLGNQLQQIRARRGLGAQQLRRFYRLHRDTKIDPVKQRSPKFLPVSLYFKPGTNACRVIPPEISTWTGVRRKDKLKTRGVPAG